jgi:hypothetical protein
MIRIQADLQQLAMNKRLLKCMKKICTDRHLTIQEIAEQANTSFWFVPSNFN